MKHDSRPGLIYLLFTLSGFAGLVYESIWSRYLKLLLGHSSYGQILTLMIFMGGLGIGSFLGGRWASRLRRPLLLYVGAEALIGLGALCYHPLFEACQRGLYALLGLQLPGPGALIAKTLAATLITIPWAIGLGLTFPALAIAVMARQGDNGRDSLPWLYFTNSLGGAAGILAASYALIPNYGTPGTLILTGSLNLLLAGLFYLFVRQPEARPDEAAALAREASPLRAELPFSGRSLVRVLLGVAFLTGLSSFLYEVSWIRLLSLMMGASTHSFDLMVSAFIGGLACGGLCARGLHRRLRRPLLALAGIQLAMGIAAALSLCLYEQLFALINQSHLVFQPSPEAYGVYALFKYALCVLLMFPASFFAGITLPLISWTLISSQSQSRQIGNVYGWNTLGSILGAFLGGLVLLPLLQLKWTLISGALIDIAIGLALMALAFGGSARLIGLATAGTASALLLWPALSLQMNAFTLSAGRYRSHDTSSLSTSESVEIRDGRTATVSFHRYADRLTIKTNGKPDASLDLAPVPGRDSDEMTQMALALYPARLMQKPYTAAMIGMGSGMTAHALLADPDLQRLDLVEIEPVMAELAQGFRPHNELVFTSPKARLIFDDAKSFFYGQPMRYDVIVSEPSNPWVSGVASLFSTEFYLDLTRFLKPEGVLVQWMHSYEFSDELLLSILAALRQNFAHVAVYGVPTDRPGQLITNDVIILASQAPLKFGRRDLSALTPSLERIRLLPDDYGPEDLIAGTETLDRLIQNANANSDYYPIVDSGAERAFYTKQRVRLFELLYDSPGYYQSLLEPGFGKILAARAAARRDSEALKLAYARLSHSVAAPAELIAPLEARKAFFSLLRLGLTDWSHPVLKAYETWLARYDFGPDRLQFAYFKALAQGDRQAAHKLADALLAQPVEALDPATLRTLAITTLSEREGGGASLLKPDMVRMSEILTRLRTHPDISETELNLVLRLMPSS